MQEMTSYFEKTTSENFACDICAHVDNSVETVDYCEIHLEKPTPVSSYPQRCICKLDCINTGLVNKHLLSIFGIM